MAALPPGCSEGVGVDDRVAVVLTLAVAVIEVLGTVTVVLPVGGRTTVVMVVALVLVVTGGGTTTMVLLVETVTVVVLTTGGGGGAMTVVVCGGGGGGGRPMVVVHGTVTVTVTGSCAMTVRAEAKRARVVALKSILTDVCKKKLYKRTVFQLQIMQKR